MTSLSLDGAVALVAGATGGIGAATATALAERGAYVLVAGRDKTRGEDLVTTIRARGDKADFVAASFATPDQCGSLRGVRPTGRSGGHPGEQRGRLPVQARVAGPRVSQRPAGPAP